MATSTCCFCAHLNPAGAKFCNECASPLNLKPCQACNAVNPRDGQACYRCGATLRAAPDASVISPEQIVAEADEMLAALRRELVGDGASKASATPDVPRAEPASQVVEAGPAFDSRPNPVARSDEPNASVADPSNRLSAQPAEPTVDASPPLIRPEDRPWRPKRRSSGVAFAAIVALAVVPVAVYVMRNPAQLDEWLGRPPASSSVEPATAQETRPASQLAGPADAPASSTAGATLEADGARTQPPATPPTDVAAPTSTPVESASGGAVDAPAAVTTPSGTEAKASPPTRPKSSAKARPRDRTTKPRPPQAPSQRGSAQPTGTEQATRTEPCTDAVAALGLCSR
jgi:hypothetical protein